MDGKQKYNIYCEMFNESHNLSNRLENAITNAGYTVYSCFISVADEETKQYFVDVEFGNDTQTGNGYKRIYGRRNKQEIEKIITYHEKLSGR